MNRQILMIIVSFSLFCYSVIAGKDAFGDSVRTPCLMDKTEMIPTISKSIVDPSIDISLIACYSGESSNINLTPPDYIPPEKDKSSEEKGEKDKAEKAEKDKAAKAEKDKLQGNRPSGIESFFINIWSLIILGIVCLVLVLYAFFLNKELKEELFRFNEFKRNSERVRLEAADEKRKLQQSLFESNNRNAEFVSIEDQNRKLVRRIKELEIEVLQLKGQGPVKKQEAPPPIVVKPAPPKMKYATYPDDPDGFSSSSVKDNTDSRTIYEFTMINENNAFVRITVNPEAQKYALGNSPHLLGKACEYINSPNDGNRIVTVKDGRVSKSDNVWKIVERVGIRFE